MPHTQQRKVALLLVTTLALALAALTMVPGFGRAQEATPAAVPEAEASELVAQGEELYNKTCIACHQAGGVGAESDISFTHYPALAGNALVTFEDPTVVVSTVLNGRAGMPSFRGMSDEQIAGVISYVRQVGDNDAAAVSPEFVAQVRAQAPQAEIAPATPLPTEPLAETTPALGTDGIPMGVEPPFSSTGTPESSGE